MDLAAVHDTPLAPVTGRINGRGINGDYNHLDKTTTVNVALDHWLPKSIKERVSNLGPLFRRLSIEMAQAEYDAAVPPRPEAAWETSDRANYWECARAGVAASCTVSGGIGSAAEGFLFAFAASLCSERYQLAFRSAS
ncbi:MAG: hypothetical protein ACREMK_11305 [Gemmatimonadota bacterium]